jgi:hypothetical protein
MFYTIYKITNKINNKIYIGKHQTENLQDGYMGSGKLISAAIKKYGLENFEKEILFVFSSKDEMNEKEREIVTEDFCRRMDTYNITSGGDGGWNYVNDHPDFDKWHKKSLDAAKDAKIKKYGENYSSVIMKRHMQKIVSDEELRAAFSKKVSDGIKKSDFDFGSTRRGKPSWNRGKKMDADHNNKISKALKEKYNNGWVSPSSGTIWITDGKENKKIKKEDLPKWEESGYYKGRKIFKDYTP